MSTLAPTSAPPAAPDSEQAGSPLVSVVIPCLNEAENIESCVTAALEAIVRMGVPGEVVVADNNSEDDSARLAEEAGARVVVERRRGYGSAYLAGFAASRGRYIVMADADLTYDFDEIPRFVAALEDGAEMVIGDRMDNIQPGAMPWLHRYVGNPILTGLLNLFFSTGVSDAHCGMRARAQRSARAPRSAHHRHGVRLRDGHQGLQGEAQDRRVPDRIPPARRREQAVELPRRLASPALPARAQPQPPVHHPRRRARRPGHA